MSVLINLIIILGLQNAVFKCLVFSNKQENPHIWEAGIWGIFCIFSIFSIKKFFKLIN